MQPAATPGAAAVTLRIKAVPGASRDALAGPLGDRLKVRITAPPQDGAANIAIRRLLAGALQLPLNAVRITAGQNRPEKTVTASGIDASTAAARLGLESGST